MEETKKKEDVEKKETTVGEMKKVKKAKLGPAATVLLSIIAALGIIVFAILMYFIFISL